MWIDRQIEPLLRQRAETRPVVVLTGARQTGKTSLMRRLFAECAFVTLDLPSEAERKVAALLPPDAVRAMSIFCRAPNPYPLGGGVAAESLHGAAAWR